MTHEKPRNRPSPLVFKIRRSATLRWTASMTYSPAAARRRSARPPTLGRRRWCWRRCSLRQRRCAPPSSVTFVRRRSKTAPSWRRISGGSTAPSWAASSAWTCCACGAVRCVRLASSTRNCCRRTCCRSTAPSSAAFCGGAPPPTSNSPALSVITK